MQQHYPVSPGVETVGAVLTIDLDAIVANWRMTASAAGVMAAAVVKADGYGLGAVPVSEALAAAGCSRFFVAHLEEGVILRAALPDPEICILNGLLPDAEEIYAAHRLAPVLNTPGQVDRWLSFCASRGETLPALLQIDTGMNRLGMTAGEWGAAALDPAVAAFPWTALISHLSCADVPEHPLNGTQLRLFQAAAAMAPHLPASLSASSGSFLGPAFAFDFVRPGAALYGVNPHPGSPNPLHNPVQLDARILQIREIDAGSPVGYGATHKTMGRAKIATIALGYADGFLRSGSGHGNVMVGGAPAPIVGRISMDLITVDVTRVPVDILEKAGWVNVIGDFRTLDDVATDAGSISYEILTSLGERFHRRYLTGATV
jgi:alanine racemase